MPRRRHPSDLDLIAARASERAQDLLEPATTDVLRRAIWWADEAEAEFDLWDETGDPDSLQRAAAAASIAQSWATIAAATPADPGPPTP